MSLSAVGITAVGTNNRTRTDGGVPIARFMPLHGVPRRLPGPCMRLVSPAASPLRSKSRQASWPHDGKSTRSHRPQLGLQERATVAQ